jgi:putative transposase
LKAVEVSAENLIVEVGNQQKIKPSNSSIVPPYVRKSTTLSVLLGDDAKGLSANVVSRLKAQWANEHVAWSRRDMSGSNSVYWWVDGIHMELRSENSNGQGG